ncbi:MULTISPECIES: ABC transporter substrate-binding protein [unclassified Synechococcus]|uniref:ABC transporter substrate-binding protein n=1 Tax=unclassified Synechococcus TaxID=2626047 RepID=UPI0020CB8219|nr:MULTISPECIES: ABC transporter substrate-binding protein [unclassified Synechococcus]
MADDKGLETKTISLGFIPVLEAAPLVVAVEKGYFATHGLEVNLSKLGSWPSARDNVVLGSAGGGIDGGQWQMPMPQMISEGAITDGKKVPIYGLEMLTNQSNGIAASNAVKNGSKFKASYTITKSNQEI